MQLRITKHIESGMTIEREKCLKSLAEAGLIITDTENIFFKEKHTITTETGKNKGIVFCPLLHGQIRIDNKNATVKWYLNIDSIIFKALLIWIIIMSGMLFLIQIEWKNALFVGVVIGFILFVINRISLESRVSSITEKIINE